MQLNRLLEAAYVLGAVALPMPNQTNPAERSSSAKTSAAHRMRRAVFMAGLGRAMKQ